MLTFKVRVEQYAEEIGFIIVKADTPEAAREIALKMAVDGDVDWMDGDHVINQRACIVTEG